MHQVGDLFELNIKLRYQRLTASGFTVERGGSSVVGRGLAGYPARPQPTTLLPPRSKVKPEAVNVAVSS